MRTKWSVLFLFLIILSACQDETTSNFNNLNQEDNNPSILRTGSNYKQEISRQVEKVVYEDHEYEDVVAVNSDDLLVVAVKPKHHDRLRLKEIRKELKDTVETSFPSYEVELSTDQKIIWELNDLQQRISDGSLTQEELKKEMERIRKLSRKQT
jgi:hypothetical protein